MQIAIASGKGGTGKTTLTTNLAHVAAMGDRSVTYLDCDVEEPNGHLFLSPVVTQERPINKRIPAVDKERCLCCGDCDKLCQYGAIICVRGSTMVFPDLCHACGGCALVCPNEAIEEQDQPIGTLRLGIGGNVRFVDGTLDVGQHMGPPAIRAVKDVVSATDLVLIDAPPGTSCSMVEAVRESDLVVLVTEPTPFGLHDLKLAVETVRSLNLRFGVVINRADMNGTAVQDYCREACISVLGELPEQRLVAEAYSRGRLACEVVPGYQQQIEAILRGVLVMAESV